MKRYLPILLSLVLIFILENTFYLLNSKTESLLDIFVFFSNKSLFKSISYFLTFLICIVSIAISPYIRNVYIAVIIGFIISLSYAVDFSYLNINGRGVTLTDLTILFSEFQNYSRHVFSTYSSEIQYGLLVGIGIIIFFYLCRIFTDKRISNYFVLVPIFSIILTSAIQVKTAATFSFGLPSPQKVLSYLVYWYPYKPYYGDREDLYVKPEFSKKYTNIIWIIDCSINANYLGINDSTYNTTPFLEKKSNSYINAGRVASITNCSSTSNIFLMGMGNKNDLPDHKEKLLRNPSIFTYAKNAGYKTAYISASSEGNRLQNYMTYFDLADIDYFFQPNTKEEKDLRYADEILADHIKGYLEKNDGSFIYVVKSGAHFPWQLNYPSEQAIYKPCLIGNEGISDASYQTILNTYLNSIRWKTDHFFQSLLKDTSILDNTLMIYTSDHGQLIPSNHNKQTHCNTRDPDIQEGIVPLLYFSNDLSKVRQPKSMFRFIPVTLDVMGYSPDVSGINAFLDFEKPGFFYGHLFPKHRIHQSGIKEIHLK